MEAAPGRHNYGGAGARGVTMLMLHGFMGRGEDWRPVVERLSPPCSCLCPDLPGHGVLRHNTCEAGATMEAIIKALSDGLDARRAEPCALTGYSLGGRIALQLAAYNPARFHCLILISTTPGLLTETERQERRRRDEALARQLAGMAEGSEAFAAFLRDWYRQPLFSTLQKNRVVMATLMHRRLENHPASLAASLRCLGTGSQPPLWERLRTLTVPTLLIVGAEDRKYRRLAEDMLAHLPRGALKIIPGCSHAPQLERPETCAGIISDFLRQTSIQ